MIKILRLEGREEDLKRIVLAFQQRKPELSKFMEAMVTCPVCGCHTIPYKNDEWVCKGSNSRYKELRKILKSPHCEGEL